MHHDEPQKVPHLNPTETPDKDRGRGHTYDYGSNYFVRIAPDGAIEINSAILAVMIVALVIVLAGVWLFVKLVLWSEVALVFMRAHTEAVYLATAFIIVFVLIAIIIYKSYRNLIRNDYSNDLV